MHFSNTLSVAALLLASFAPSALADIFTTEPTAATICNGGQICRVLWRDNGVIPLLPEIGDVSIGLFAGNSQQQTLIQAITPSINVAQNGGVEFTVDANVGPNSAHYFIRYTALVLRSAQNNQLPHLQFSSKFQLNNMRGQFNATVQAQIDATPGAPSSGAPSTGAPSASNAPPRPSSTSAAGGSASNRSASSTASRASSTPSQSSNAALGAPAASISSKSIWTLGVVVAGVVFGAAVL